MQNYTSSCHAGECFWGGGKDCVFVSPCFPLKGKKVFVSLFCGGLFIIVTDDEISDRHGSQLRATRWKL